MAKINLNDLKNEINKNGASRGKFMFFKEGTKARVRFLQEFDEGIAVKFHDSFELSVNVPCQEQYGRDCPYCENNDLRTRTQYAWSVYDYEQKDVRILMFPVNSCTPVSAMASLYESYGTIVDRDYEIKQQGNGSNKTFSVIPLDKSTFKNKKVKALSESTMLKYIDKAYPSDLSSDEEEDEEDERPKKGVRGKMNEPEDDDWEEDDETKDYSSMSARELYKLCKERDIDCEPKKLQKYYIRLLESADAREEDDDWEEDWEE